MMKSIKTSRLSILFSVAVFCTYFAIYTAVALIYSGCSDETVSSNYNIDLPRFNWRTVNLNANNVNYVWAKDTADIYLMSMTGSKLFKLSGGILTNYNIGNHYMKQLSGTENNIVIFALDESNELKFIFWNGTPLEIQSGLFLADTLGIYFSGCATTDMGSWMCSQTGIVSCFGGIIKHYFIEDPMFIPDHIFKSQQNTIRVTGSSRNLKRIYELQDSDFVKIFEYSGNFSLNVMQNEAYGYFMNQNMTGPCFYDISGNNFIENSCINTNIPVGLSNYFTGTSFSNMYFNVYSHELFNELSYFGILHWDGNKLSREFELYGTNPGINDPEYFMHNIDENKILILEGTFQDKKLHLGTKK